MKFQDLLILLPCQSLEDFSLQRKPDDAEEILSAYSALWHPALLCVAQDVPHWIGADTPPTDPSGHLIIAPRSCHAQLPDGWLDRAHANESCVLLDDLRHREEMVAAALEQVDGGDAGVDPELARDFLALGFGHLLAELLTRQLRYMSNLDEVRFRSEAVGAAEAALKGNAESARDQIRNAFEQLTEAREYFYPVDAYMIDLTLAATTTLGPSLREVLECKEPTNLLISGADVARMAAEHPQTLAALKSAIEKETVSLVGGCLDDWPLPLMPIEAVAACLRRGRDAYQQHLGTVPKTFGRRRFGLTPVLPQLLTLFGFESAFHFTLDDGRFPSGNQSKIHWEGIDGTAVDALARLPQDATRPDAFLSLPENLGDTLDLDHTATAVLARWPGQSSRWYEDLRRMIDYSRVFGRFLTADAYFQETHLAGQEARYKPDQYRSPYLRQEVSAGAADPISRWARYYRRRARVDAKAAMECLAQLVTGQPGAGQGTELLAQAADDLVAAGSGDEQSLDDRIDAQFQQATDSLGAAVNRSPDAQNRGILLLNPCSFPRRQWVDVSGLDELPAVGDAVHLAAESGETKEAVVNVPPMGFAWVGPGGSGDTTPAKSAPRRRGPWWRKPKPEPPIVEENVLRNEYFEVSIDPTTGAIHSLHDYRHRDNRLSQQLALRSPEQGERDALSEEGDDRDYSVMAADSVRITAAGPVTAEIECRGRLVDRSGHRLAGFCQTVRVRRGSRLLELDIELEPDRQPGSNPWDSYYAARFAWGDATADLARSICQTACPTDAVRLEAPHFIDIRGEKTRTTILTGGLPYHRKFGLRKLDTLLVVRGETERRFQLGIGVELTHPMAAAMDWLSPSPNLVQQGRPGGPMSAWLLHLDARNALLTGWEPLVESDRVVGFRAQVLETEGRRVEATLRSFRPIESARRVDFGRLPSSELPVEGDGVRMSLGAHQFTQIEAKFA